MGSLGSGEDGKRFSRRAGLVVLGPDAVSIVEDDAGMTIPVKLPDRFLHLAQLSVTQLGQDFLNLTHSAHDLFLAQRPTGFKRRFGAGMQHASR